MHARITTLRAALATAVIAGAAAALWLTVYDNQPVVPSVFLGK